MTKKHLIFIMTLAVIFGNVAALPALADLQVRNDAVFGAQAIVYDSATGLEWLRLPLSGTKSYDDMIGVDGTSEFAPGQQFAGFRHATMAEVEQLWVNAGIAADYFFYGTDESHHNIGIYQTNDSAAVDAARTLQGLIGYTLTQAYPPYVSTGGWNTRGLATAPDGVGYPCLETCTVGTGFCGGSSVPMARAHLGGLTVPKTQIGHRHWLVRVAQKRPIIQRKTLPARPNLRVRDRVFDVVPKN